MRSLELNLIVIPLANLAIGWVYRRQYQGGGPPRALLVGIHGAAVAAIIVVYWILCAESYRPTPWRYPGWLLFAGGAFLFWYAAFVHPVSLVPDETRGVTNGGPYRRIRHPIYAGGLLGAFGLLLVSPTWRVALAWAVLFGSLWVLMLAEERELRGRLGAAYEDYCRRTWRLIPGVF